MPATRQDDWIPLWPNDFYVDQRIELVLGRRVVVDRSDAPDRASRRRIGSPVWLAAPRDRRRTGAADDSRRDDDHVRYLRTFADSRAIVATRRQRPSASSSSAPASSAWRSRRHCGPAASTSTSSRRRHAPLERVMGVEVGRFVRSLHEAHGVTFHLGQTVARIDGRDGDAQRRRQRSTADLVVMGVGVRPALAIAEQAGLAIDRGIVVERVSRDERAGIFAAGDVARWPDAHTRPNASASSTGWSPSARGRSPRATCSARASASTRCRSSGASTTTLDQLRRPRRALGRGRYRRLARGARLLGEYRRGGKDARDRDHRARPGEPGSRGQDGARMARISGCLSGRLRSSSCGVHD